MIKKSRIGNYLKPMLLAGILFVCSCNNDEIVKSNRVTTSDVVIFNINKSSQWTPDVIDEENGVSEAENRSARQEHALGLSNSFSMDILEGNAPETEISMYMVEENYPQEVDTLSVKSRAEGDAPVEAPSVGLISYHTVDNTIKTFMDNINLSTYNNNVYWPGSGLLKFYAYSPRIEVSETANNGLLLSVENNEPKFIYEVPTDVTKQYDLMDGVTVDIPGDHLKDVDINIYHVMSKVQVKLGTMVEGNVQSIMFTNLYNKGTRKLGSDGWTVDNESKKDYTFSIDENNTAITIPMYLMPQNLSDDAAIVIEMSVTSDNPYYDEGSEEIHAQKPDRTNTYTLTKKLKEFIDSWAPNKTYTYVISTPEEVKVEVSDEIVLEGDYPVKKNFTITNTGLSNCYVRVAMLGSWMLDHDIDGVTKSLIVADWKPNEDGKFDWATGSEPPTDTFNANYWHKDEDGFYYYMHPLKRGESILPLFDKYTLTASPPMAGAYLNFEIVVQAVLEQDLYGAWPEHLILSPIKK